MVGVFDSETSSPGSNPWPGTLGCVNKKLIFFQLELGR